MSDFTYETRDAATPLETFEWDNTWHERAMREDRPRLLYIGDSISVATRRLITEQSEKAWLADGFGSSKALDNPYLLDAIRLFAAQQNRCDAVIFNNGLHGWHLEDGEAYKTHYERVLRGLLSLFAHRPLLLVLTTTVADGARAARVCPLPWRPLPTVLRRSSCWK